MADWTAITGIVVSGVVGPSLGAWWAVRRLDREHRYASVLADRAEARTVLDEAARDISRAGRYRDVLEPHFTTYGASIREGAGELLETFHDAARNADAHNARLALRFGAGTPIAVGYNKALRAIIDASDAMGLAADLGDRADLRATWDKLKASGESFRAAHAEFMAAAHDAAQVRLDA